MGSRARSKSSRPKFVAAAVVFLALAVGAFLFGEHLVPLPQASDASEVSHYSAMHHAGHWGKHRRRPRPEASATPGSDPSPTPSATTPAPSQSSSTTPTTKPTTPSSGTSTAPATTPSTSVPTGNVSCNYDQDTWSGDAAGDGYTVSETQETNGDLSSYHVVLNANAGNTEVVGYPSEQCLMYSALPSTLTSSMDITPPANSSGLDYEYAYDIWLTTASAATSDNWNNDLELMIWTYVNGQVPAGSVAATLSDGSKVWVSGNNTSGTVSVVLPQNETSETVNIASIISQLKALGYVTSADTGILDVEYGIEAPYGGGQTFAVNGFSVTAG